MKSDKWIKIQSTMKRVKRQRLQTARTADAAGQVPGMGSGYIFAKRPAKGRRAKGVFGVTESADGTIGDPTYKLADMIQSALTKPPRFGVCTVYDAEGKPIATIDPFTRERKPL